MLSIKPRKRRTVLLDPKSYWASIGFTITGSLVAGAADGQWLDDRLCWRKGRTGRDVIQRFHNQHRTTALPEEPMLWQVYPKAAAVDHEAGVLPDASHPVRIVASVTHDNSRNVFEIVIDQRGRWDLNPASVDVYVVRIGSERREGASDV